MSLSTFVEIEPQPSVLVLEDSTADCELILRGLEKAGVRQCVVTESVDEFEKRCQEYDFQVASIDWDINNTFLGHRALHTFKQFHKGSASVVFTVNDTKAHVKKRAFQEGADVVIGKSADLDDTNYIPSMKKAARVAFARELVAAVKRISNSEMPVLEPRLEMTVETERKICQISRRVAINRCFSEEEDAGLIDILKKRSWWRVFDPSEYSNLPWSEKLKSLTDCAELPYSLISKMIHVNPGSVQATINCDGSRPGCGSSVAERLDKLLSVLFFLLRISGYEPELLRRYVNSSGIFSDCATKPPWDDQGLIAFITQTGPSALDASLEWARRV